MGGVTKMGVFFTNEVTKKKIPFLLLITKVWMCLFCVWRCGWVGEIGRCQKKKGGEGGVGVK